MRIHNGKILSIAGHARKGPGELLRGEHMCPNEIGDVGPFDAHIGAAKANEQASPNQAHDARQVPLLILRTSLVSVFTSHECLNMRCTSP